MQAFEARAEDFAAAGAEIIAVTGELPEHFSATAPNLPQLSFPICHDDGYAVMDEYGLPFQLTDALNEIYANFGLDLAAAAGTSEPMLPVPATYVVQPGGSISHAWVELDHTTRPEVQDVLDAVKGA